MSLWILWDAPTKPAFFHLEGVIKTEGWEKICLHVFSVCTNNNIVFFPPSVLKCSRLGLIGLL